MPNKDNGAILLWLYIIHTYITEEKEFYYGYK